MPYEVSDAMKAVSDDNTTIFQDRRRSTPSYENYFL